MRKIANSELGRPDAQEFAAMRKLPVTIVLDNLRSLNNIGSFFRTADAFAMERIFLCGISATPPNREIHKTALGAELTVPWEYLPSGADAVGSLEAQGYDVFAVEQVEGAAMLNDLTVDKSKKYALVFGNEVAGVSQEVVDMCGGAIEIPQYGTKHSLNVAVSGGVVLWEFFRQYNR